MRTMVVRDFDEWRKESRLLLGANVEPSAVTFRAESEQGLFDWNAEREESPIKSSSPQLARVPKAFVESARMASYYRHERVWNLLYRVLWRLAHDEHDLLADAADDDVYELNRIVKAVSRDAHKMKAFVRFRKITDGSVERFVAWHRPDHKVLRQVAPFFARRFTDMHWTIFTPDESATWDGEELSFGDGVPANAVNAEDCAEEMWRTYYRSIFNPARIKLKMMRREMPVRHWATLPETRILPEMLAEAPQRVNEMLRHQSPAAPTVVDLLPEVLSLPALSEAAAKCEACDLCRRAAQTVFGRGPTSARLMLVGEQPGDEEDRRGEPFVGPAGQLLRRTIADIGLNWDELYVTNAVKHFHWEPQGARRLHKQPPARALSACHDWLRAEVEVVKPAVILCLGATAAKAVLGRDSSHLKDRGTIVPSQFGPRAIVTWHPAAILRATSSELRERMGGELVKHLLVAKTFSGPM